MAELYRKQLPPAVPIGESWEVSDRPEGVSVIDNGPFAGRDLRWLMRDHGEDLFGGAKVPERFPLLLKILDARETLSLQVHPPAAMAANLGGEPKTEMWYIAQAEPGAELFVGLKRGVTRQEFERGIRDGSVADCFHRIPVRAGDAMFLPSGRVHALGGGIVLFEIQQNSDTTYRVFDWNRVDAAGKPRELHVEKSLASIDFNDFEPELLPRKEEKLDGISTRRLVKDPLFQVNALRVPADAALPLPEGKMRILAVISGELQAGSPEGRMMVGPGDFLLMPACRPQSSVRSVKASEVLEIGID